MADEGEQSKFSAWVRSRSIPDLIYLVSAGITIWQFVDRPHHFGDLWYVIVLLSLSLAWLGQRHWSMTRGKRSKTRNPALVVTPVVGGSIGHLMENSPPGSMGIEPGGIYMKLVVFVNARADIEFPITVLRAKARIQFEDEDSREYETGQFEWFDEMATDDEGGVGLPTAQKGSVLHLMFTYVGRANSADPGVDGSERKFHLPAKTRVVALTVFDSLNRPYYLEKSFEIPIFRWDEPTPFIPG